MLFYCCSETTTTECTRVLNCSSESVTTSEGGFSTAVLRVLLLQCIITVVRLLLRVYGRLLLLQ